MGLKDFKNKAYQKLYMGVSKEKIFAAQAKNKRNVCGLTNKNLKDRNDLIRKYVYLVNWVVHRLPVTTLKGIEKEDLVGYGTVGLIEAVDRFDSSRNTNFESFAITRIRGCIYDQLRASDWLSRGSRQRVKKMLKAVASLEHKLGRYPTDTEIAKELEISKEELRVIQQESQIGIFSLDEPKDNYSDDNSSLVDNVSANTQPFLEKLEENELKERLTKAVSNLPEREKTVIGLYHYKKLTFKEIAVVMNFSESRASQIHARAISLLKSKILKD